jgi:hypothetical protein
MGSLTSYLQKTFVEFCPPEWSCRHEVQLLSAELQQVLGYSPRADVLLERTDGSRRLWIEFEVSRADPVANHAKFATAHLFKTQSESDSFVAMVSPHVNRGRRNLASNTIFLMRYIGMNAFQTVLLPHLSAQEVKRLNHLDSRSLQSEKLTAAREIERALSISEAVLTTAGKRIHLAGDLLEVILNLRRWNFDMRIPEFQALWKKRTVTYFVFDSHSGDFAPSKFCAYVAVPSQTSLINSVSPQIVRSEMTIDLYVTLDGTDSRFDGRRAWTHLTNSLAMKARNVNESAELLPLFRHWLARNSSAIRVHPSGTIFLTAPDWFK